MDYKMRKLKTSDIFKMSKILKKMNIKFNGMGELSQTEFGIQFIQRIVENIHLAEEEVNSFLAELVGISPEEFAELPIEDTIKIITLFKEQKEVVNFLSLAGK